MHNVGRVFALRAVFVALGCAAGACGAEHATPGTPADSKVTTKDRSLNSAYRGVSRGHQMVTMKAAEYLARRGLLPPVLQQQGMDYVNYGNDFADHPHLGRPGDPTTPIENHMTARIPAMAEAIEIGRTQQTFDLEIPTPTLGNVVAHVKGLAKLRWAPKEPGHPSTSLRYGLTLSVTPDTPWFSFDLPVLVAEILSLGHADIPDVGGTQTYPFEYALDNYYHYALRDIYDLSVGASGVGEIRLYPFYGEHGAASTAAYLAKSELERWTADRIADRMRNQVVLTQADYGVAKYGAILFELARKFFPGARAEPDLAELIKAGNDVPGWRTGYMQGIGYLNNMHLDMPHTYLGGMPFICSGSTSLDPCATGQPTWPGWITTSGPLSVRENPHPGQSDMAALIYLGWATHMIQDAAVPHHAANWSGKEHEKQDALGDFFSYYEVAGCDLQTGDCWQPGPNSLEVTATAEVDALLGPESAPKSRRDICRSVGIIDSQVQPGRLDWETVYPVFLETMRTAFHSRQERLESHQEIEAGRQIVKNAVLATAKLLLCATPGIETGENDRKDFNGDLHTDVLWHNPDTGVLSAWFLDGTTVLDDGALSWTVPESTGWQVKGTGDFNGDGQADVLWHNPGTGSVGFWAMNGTTVLDDEFFNWTVSGSTGWELRGTGDFNRDGHVDLLWHNPGTGSVSVWFLDGTTSVAGSAMLSWSVQGSTGWELRGTGDFDRDGHVDVLWHNPGTGAVAVWLMNGTTVAGPASLNWTVLGSTGWELRGTGDFNRDGKVDLLWHRPASASVSVWLMNGTTVSNAKSLSWSAGAPWKIVSR